MADGAAGEEDGSKEPRLYDGAGDSERHAELRSHYESFFDVSGRELTWPATSPVHAIPGFRVLEVPPNAETELWTYASIGSFASARAGDTPAEFVLVTDAQTPAAVELVTWVAHYHALQPLAVGQTVALGKAWLPGATCDAFLVSPPYPFGESLARAPLDRGDAQVLWLLPITPAERRFVKTHGVEALEAAFELEPVRYWLADRGSVVP